MNTDSTVIAAREIIASNRPPLSKLAETLEFLRIYAGENSVFYKKVDTLPGTLDIKWSNAKPIFESYIRFLENGLMDGVSLERRAQIDVVSDFLEQANQLLYTKGVHPAAPCVLIGAALEEFLRNWVESEGLSNENSKPSIDTYTKALKEADLITKQDFKDITSWAGLRNHAAHGEWDEVSDKKRIALMLEGVNLFMRKYFY